VNSFNSEYTDFKEKEKDKQFDSGLKGLKLRSHIIILASLVVLIVVCLAKESLPPAYKEMVIVNIIVDLFEEFGIALFVLGAVAITLEITEFTHYFAERLRSVILLDDYMDRISDEEKKSLIEKLENLLYFRDKKENAQEFYKLYKTTISNMIDKPFFDKYDIMVECSINKEKKIIKKKIIRTIEVTNPIKDSNRPNYNQKINIPSVHTCMEKIDGMKNEELYKINKLSIDNKDVKIEKNSIKYVEIPVSEDNYNLEVNLDYPLSLVGTKIIRMETETIVPINDVHFSQELMYPCKRYSATFMLKCDSQCPDNDKYAVEGFGLSSQNGDSSSKYESDRYEFDRCIKIIFNDWILPGAGVCFSLFPKEYIRKQ
jgi:hypothetical protein